MSSKRHCIIWKFKENILVLHENCGMKNERIETFKITPMGDGLVFDSMCELTYIYTDRIEICFGEGTIKDFEELKKIVEVK